MFRAGTGNQPIRAEEFGQCRHISEQLDEESAAGLLVEAEAAGLYEAGAADGAERRMVAENVLDRRIDPAEVGPNDTDADGGGRLLGGVLGQEAEAIGLSIEHIG